MASFRINNNAFKKQNYFKTTTEFLTYNYLSTKYIFKNEGSFCSIESHQIFKEEIFLDKEFNKGSMNPKRFHGYALEKFKFSQIKYKKLYVYFSGESPLL